ncbi:hypothetical protein CEXT_334521 [Caerostris extrusa]|uniref:Uncharacterized protein n=1 Tax=Caerostris extrusa TaxID=172846 RepID=A0AAV4MXY6_CAEEX|nr:hypothetical protein CEXT_334521 [Caerostris extrusa]
MKKDYSGIQVNCSLVRVRKSVSITFLTLRTPPPTATTVRNALSGLLPVCYSTAHVILNPNLRVEMWKSSVPRPSLAVLNEKREAWG